MRFNFHKYQGTGNDFVMIDDCQKIFPTHDSAFIARCCDRRFGIGADGLILIQKSNIADFKMAYFNADGRESTLCGNGARCAVAFAVTLGIIDTSTVFEAVDGQHQAKINNDGTIALRMHDVKDVLSTSTYCFLDTGSPHHVEMVENLADYDVVEKGRSIRQGAPYFEEGSNVNFVEKIDDTHFNIRTYERGVEDETLSCGTGATAVALAMHYIKETTATRLTIGVQGGTLIIYFTPKADGYGAIDLIGPATFVYAGRF